MPTTTWTETTWTEMTVSEREHATNLRTIRTIRAKVIAKATGFDPKADLVTVVESGTRATPTTFRIPARPV